MISGFSLTHWMIILSILTPDWPAPRTIRAATTLRYPGASLAPYDGNNMGLHVGDDLQHVLANRRALTDELNLPGEPEWLEQTHSTRCVVVEDDDQRQADASVTRSRDRVLAIMTADCLPILFCNRQGTEIAAIHAGWRGLVNGIIDNSLDTMHSQTTDLIAWVGPAICGSCYEVGNDVRDACVRHYPFGETCFKPHAQKWLLDLPGLAALVLKKRGIHDVFLSQQCTFEDKNAYYSYRREAQTGRIATLVWFNQE